MPNPTEAPPLPDDVAVTTMKRGNISQPDDRHVTRRVSRDLPFLMDGDFLQVENLEQDTTQKDRQGKTRTVPARTWDFRWARKHYIIEPGEIGFVPFEALVNALGDPRSQDDALTHFDDGNGNSGTVMPRHFELSRLYATYAIQEERLTDFEKVDPATGRTETIVGLLSRTPKVRIKTLAGQEVRFPGQSPDMLPYPVANTSPTKVDSDMRRIADQLNSENAELRDRVAALERHLDEKYEGTSPDQE